MTRCISCGETIENDVAIHCPFCGAPLRQADGTLLGVGLDAAARESLGAAPAGPGPGDFYLAPLGEAAGEEAGQALVIGDSEAIIGRSEQARLQVRIPTVSRRHAAVWLQAGVPYLRDLGSQRGTRLNDAPVSEPTAMCAGDRLSLGKDVHFEVRFAPHGADTMPEDLADGAPPADRDGKPESLPPADLSRGSLTIYLESIARLTSDIVEAETEAALFEIVLDQLSTVIVADRYCVILGTSVGELQVEQQRLRDPAPEGQLPPPSKGILRRVLYSLSERPYVTYDARAERGIGERTSIVMSDVRSVICVGLNLDKKRCVGMLYADTLSSGEDFTAADERYVQIVAQLAAAHMLLLRSREALARYKEQLEREQNLPPGGGLSPVDLT